MAVIVDFYELYRADTIVMEVVESNVKQNQKK